MAWEFLIDRDRNKAAFFCNTTDHAFGPILNCPSDQIDEYLASIERELIDSGVADPRVVSSARLANIIWEHDRRNSWAATAEKWKPPFHQPHPKL